MSDVDSFMISIMMQKSYVGYNYCKSNNANSNRIWAQSAQKNIQKLIERHRDFYEGEMHGFDMEVL